MFSVPSYTTAGTAFTVNVVAHDVYGNLAMGYSGTVHLSSTDALAVLVADLALSNGVGAFSVTLKTAGSQTVTATDIVTNKITGTSTTINVVHATAVDHIAIVQFWLSSPQVLHNSTPQQLTMHMTTNGRSQVHTLPTEP